MTAGKPKTTKIIKGADLVKEPAPNVFAVVNPHIPLGGITLLFGPPSVGKTAFNWTLGNAMYDGAAFLGHATMKGKVLFISLDMNETLCKIRLAKTGFIPKFDLVFSTLPVDCLDQNFKHTEFYKEVQAQVKAEKYTLIQIDNLRRLGQFKMSDDDAPPRVYDSLQAWLPGHTLEIIHHSRKQRVSNNGSPVDASMDDAFGSQFWAANAASVISLRSGSQRTTLVHNKSQVFQLADAIHVVVDPKTSTLVLGSDYKAETAENLFNQWSATAQAKHPNWDTVGTEDRIQILMEISGKSRATIYRLFKTCQKSQAQNPSQSGRKTGETD